MGYQTGFHAPNGGQFLGYRKARNGSTEVIYDDGVNRRVIWQLGAVDEGNLSDALSEAVVAPRIVPALMTELRKRAIQVERMVE